MGEDEMEEMQFDSNEESELEKIEEQYDYEDESSSKGSQDSNRQYPAMILKEK